MSLPAIEVEILADPSSAVSGFSKAASAQKAFEAQTAKVSRTANINTHALRNVSMQLNQVGQQAAVTGNFMQALSIQLPDMLAGFGGLAPAIAGAALGLAPPLSLNLYRRQVKAKISRISLKT